jgi:hypothetical protein
MLRPAKEENKTKVCKRGLTKCNRSTGKRIRDQSGCEKLMKRNEKIDEQFGINASNLQSLKWNEDFAFTNWTPRD